MLRRIVLVRETPLVILSAVLSLPIGSAGQANSSPDTAGPNPLGHHPELKKTLKEE